MLIRNGQNSGLKDVCDIGTEERTEQIKEGRELGMWVFNVCLKCVQVCTSLYKCVHVCTSG